MNLGLSAKIDDKFGCTGAPSNNINYRIEVQSYAMFIFCLNLELMSVHLNQSFVTGSIPGGLTATLALHKWRSKNATLKTPLIL